MMFSSNKNPLFVLSSNRSKKEFFYQSHAKLELIKNIDTAFNKGDIKEYFYLFDNNIHYESKDCILPHAIGISELYDKITYTHKPKIPHNMRYFFMYQALQTIKSIHKLSKDDFLSKHKESYYLQISNIMFNFYDELRGHKIPISEQSFHRFLSIDSYDEYDSELSLLSEIYEQYILILDANGLQDHIHSNDISNNYEIFTDYINHFSSIHIELEGFISPLQYEILQGASNVVPVFLHFKTDSYNINNFTFLEKKLKLVAHNRYIYAIHDNVLHSESDKQLDISKLKLYKTKSVFNEANLALHLAHKWHDEITSNKAKENDFAIILTDESFANHLATLDSNRVLNFAMGEKVSTLAQYSVIESIIKYFVQSGIFDITPLVNFLTESRHARLKDIIALCATGCYIIDNPNLDILQEIISVLFRSEEKILSHAMDILSELRYMCEQEFLHVRKLDFLQLANIFIHAFSNISRDDVAGGKIKVIGALEARCLAFKEALIVDFTDDYVPNVAYNDTFINSKIREHFFMPTQKDKENLYKHHYYNIMKNSETCHISYVSNDTKMPSNMLLEIHANLELAQNIDSNYTYYDSTETFLPCVEKEDYPSFSNADISLSAISLNMYNECVRKFYFYYIESMKPEQESSDSVTVALIMHQWLEESYKNVIGKYLNIKDIDIVRDIFLKKYNEFSYNFFNNKHMQKDIELYANLDRNVYFMEKFFSYEKERVSHECIKILSLEKDFATKLYSNNRSFNIKGRIDRIDLVNDRLLAIDYKTGSKPANSSLQMALYRLFLREVEDENIVCGYYLIKDTKLDIIKNSILDNNEKTIMDILHTFGKENTTAQDLSICKNCEYIDICGM